MKRLLFCLAMLANGHAALAAAEIIPAYNSYSAVPFVVGDGGLAQETVAYLNNKLKGKYQLQLKQVSRDTLNNTVLKDPDFKGIVLFLGPFFVDDSAKAKYHWSPALIGDSNAVISLKSRKLEYSGPEDLAGLKFGGIKGNRYAGLEEHFGKDIQREDVQEEFSNIKKVASGKVDVTIMASSTFRFLMKQMGAEAAAGSNLYTSSRPHFAFERHVFSAKGDAALAKEIDAAVAASKTDPVWRALLSKYGLE
ncbi:transporter substrate-binding domain-containing protein [Massilia sp. CCM 8695]|uniref:Transporter substrate-binding domain-containing protein n=1 Tax=Massilia frigida TaxID=2609281 RepID=A0ABX0NFH8_9BURK|nr:MULTISPECIES: transporter substrate-binding domain-containing protein [Massilia]MDM5180390.1 transporter substrate-binding domain-containing protein [Massilia sp. DJPM01]NHZ80540.1 transporter substrate-binding domain-containing protein [Massilia frigida]